MIVWYAVHTRARAEATAAEHLRRQGYAVYLPLERVWVRHARRRTMVKRPVFPRYLFVGVDRDTMPWRPILSTVGVADVVRAGEQPTEVAREVIALLGEREHAGAFDRLTASRRFKPGDVVRVVEGPFERSIRCLVEATGDERVCILFEIMGRSIRSWLSADALEAA